ncbi:flagellar biosynthesis anti-sigma factor FlgM [Bacillota bacterium LX-D]|nr:flagellar biosynthesis anti-sigma factor FlgM [Bacillota bacterium LX-D]
MKIQGNSPVKINALNAYQKSGSPRKSENIQQDSVELSAQAKEIAELQKKAGQLPEVRQERVADLKQKIAQGQYQIPAEKLADKLLQTIAQEKK